MAAATHMTKKTIKSTLAIIEETKLSSKLIKIKIALTKTNETMNPAKPFCDIVISNFVSAIMQSPLLRRV